MYAIRSYYAARRSAPRLWAINANAMPRSPRWRSRAFIVGSAHVHFHDIYGHARFAELMLGGVTRQLLTEMTLPVLMSH